MQWCRIHYTLPRTKQQNGLGKQDTTVFPLPYFWSTNFHRSHQQNLNHEGAKARSWGDKQCLLHSKRLLQSFYRRQFNPVQSNVGVSSKHLLHLKINCNRLEIRKKLNTLLPKWGIRHPSGCSGELLLEKKKSILNLRAFQTFSFTFASNKALFQIQRNTSFHQQYML